ncbi:UNVERIFIED_CONTAM: hypothetical protein Slati_3743200 [Sesamum latifolium]|uniref:Reverse transcriptase n=1 Tax=Sesamum latifolium TaxID=2727402 RepID=A0AAW2U2K2_9LAMI
MLVIAAEIKEAFFDISEDSAPGPDGYPSAFYKAAWPDIGAYLSAAITEFFQSWRLLKQINATLLVLIPKVQLPVRLSDYRPIACCNVIYKSTSTIKDTLAEFVVMSSLRVNPSKSQIILSKAVQTERQAILDLMGFQEGSLPIKYLGVPLISSRLTIADCQPLIDKIDNKLAGWSQFNLSLAGRTQLIKSVLSSLHTCWASVFILPKSIINIIEGRMRKFLWQGSSGRGYAKEDTQSIWVQWILLHRRHNQTIWTYSRGPSLHSFPRGPSITGLPSDSLLMTVLQQGCWNWPSVTDFDIQEIISCLPNTFPQQSDSITWRSNSGKFYCCGYFSITTSISSCFLASPIGRDLFWASKRWRGKHLLNAAARTLLASIVYNIWMERNSSTVLGYSIISGIGGIEGY